MAVGKEEKEEEAAATRGEARGECPSSQSLPLSQPCFEPRTQRPRWLGGWRREQDRFLPIANISRIMKKKLPGNAKIAKDAKETVQECVSEFISFITSECAAQGRGARCGSGAGRPCRDVGAGAAA